MRAKLIKETIDSYEDLRQIFPESDKEEELDNIDFDEEEIQSQYELLPSKHFDKFKRFEAYEPKDLKRVKDFALKGGGDFSKEVMLAQRMANTITNIDKAIGRAEAAAEVYGERNEIVEIFYNKAKELGYQGPPPGERLEVIAKKPLLGSKLSKEQQYKNLSKYRNSGRYNGNPILPLGHVDLRSGDSKYFNIYDTWLSDNSNTTVEIWRDTNKGFRGLGFKEKQDEPKSELDLLLKPKSKEEVDLAKRSYFNYRLVFTSGSEPLHEIGEISSFSHDQTGNYIGTWEMVDYVSLKHLKEAILPYGKKIPGYTYK